MNVPRRFTLIATATVAAVSLMAAPTLAEEPAPETSAVLAVEDEPETESGSGAEDEDHRISLADTPRNRFKLLLFGVLFVGGGIALANARRQMKGERDQATGEFRWR